MEFVEEITDNGKTLAYIIRGKLNLEETTFPTPPESNHQVGFIVYAAGGEVACHVHRPLERHVVRTSEVPAVKKGWCIEFFQGTHYD